MADSKAAEVRNEKSVEGKESSDSQASNVRTIFSRARATLTSASLRDAVREIVIVTLGILIAFALNAWWENHKERRQEQENLRALVNDFELNIGQLDESAKTEDLIAKNCLELLEVAHSGKEPPLERMRILMGGVFTSNRFAPVMGAYDALVNSAGLTVIHDDKLRTSLANFSANVNGRYGERFGDDMYFALIREFSGRLQLAKEVEKREPSLAVYMQLLADPKFQDYLAIRYLSEGQMGDHYRMLKARAETIRDLLRKEIRYPVGKLCTGYTARDAASHFQSNRA